MTLTEYSLTGCNNKHSKFEFADGTIATGVITTFFFDEPSAYYFVKTSNMREFKEYMDRNDYTKMKMLCEQVDLRQLQSAKREMSIVFKLKAKMTLDYFEQELQKEIINTIKASVKNDLNDARQVEVGHKKMFVIKVADAIKVFMQVELDQVIVNDIILRFSE